MTDKDLIKALRCCDAPRGCKTCQISATDCYDLSAQAANRLEELLTENEHSQWVRVDERLPANNIRVIVARAGGTVEQAFRRADGWWKVFGANTKDVTHWRPLPEPPCEDEADGD